jgi:hypothetical protein
VHSGLRAKCGVHLLWVLVLNVCALAAFKIRLEKNIGNFVVIKSIADSDSPFHGYNVSVNQMELVKNIPLQWLRFPYKMHQIDEAPILHYS